MQQLKAEAQRMYAGGMTQATIARTLGVYSSTVLRWVNPVSYAKHRTKSKEYMRRKRLDKAKRMKDSG